MRVVGIVLRDLSVDDAQGLAIELRAEGLIGIADAIKWRVGPRIGSPR
jgi:hypothetical protein